jgi:hypothetical protein
MKTPGWLSKYVKKISGFPSQYSGVALDKRGHDTVHHPVSIPRDRGATPGRSKSWVFSEVSPERIAAWAAAP